MGHRRHVFHSTGNHYIHITGFDGNKRFEIFDLGGRMLDSGQLFSNSPIDVNGLDPGTYLIRIEAEGVTETHHFQVIGQ